MSYTHVFICCGAEKFSLYEPQVLGLLQAVSQTGAQPLHLLFHGPQRSREENLLRLRRWNAAGFTLMLPYSKPVTAFARGAIASPAARWILQRARSSGQSDHPDRDIRILLHCRNEPAALWGITIASQLRELCSRSGRLAEGRRLTVKVLFDNRGIRTEEVPELNPRALFTNLSHLVSKAWASRRVDAYSFVTGAMARHFLASGYRSDIPSIVVPTCVNPDHYTPLPWKERSYDLVYCGGTIHWQGMDRVLSIIGALETAVKASGRALRTLALVNEPEALLPQARELGLRNLDIRRVAPDQVPRELCNCRIGLLLRDSSLLNRVAAPTKMGEYLAAGLKVAYTGSIGSVEDLLKFSPEASEWLIDMDQLKDDDLTLKLLLELDSPPPEKRVHEYFTWAGHLKKYRDLFF